MSVLSVIASCSIRIPDDMRNYTQSFLMLSFLVYHCNLRFYSGKIGPEHLFHLKVACVCECCVFTSSQAVIHIEHLSSNTIFGICGFENKWKEEKMVFHCHDGRWCLREKNTLILINHNDGITQLELDMLEYEVKWAFSSVQFSRSVVSDSLRPHELQRTRPPCPSQTPGVYSNSCPSSQ